MATFVAASVAGSFLGWVAFFVIGACLLHAFVEWRCGNSHAVRLLVAGSVTGAVTFILVLAHIAWAFGGDLSDLRRIFVERTGAGGDYGAIEWIIKMFGFHRRLFTVTGTAATLWLGSRVLTQWKQRNESGRRDPLIAAACMFAVADLAYVVVFNWGAWQHHYWQYPMLPGVVIAMGLALGSLATWSAGSPLRRALVAVVVLEILATSAVGLYKRHAREETYVIETVKALREENR